MRGVGADRLDVHAAEPATGRNDDLDLRPTRGGSGVTPGQRVVGPADRDRVSLLATVVADAMTPGIRLPLSLSCLKKSRPFVASSSEPPLARPEAKTERMAPLAGHAGIAGEGDAPLYSSLSRSAQSFGTLGTSVVLTSNAKTP